MIDSLVLTRRIRSFTLTEVLIGSAALALFLIVALAALFPVLNYLSASQAKIDTQSNAVPVLYRLQREIRQSDAQAIFYQPSPSASATPLPSGLTSVKTFAATTAKTGSNGDSCYPGGAFDTDAGSGGPIWHAFEVFTLLSNGTLTCVYEQLSSPQNTPPTAAQATAAINAGLAVSNPPHFGNAVFGIQLAAEPGVPAGAPSTVIDMKIQSIATVNGRTNATTYTLNLLTRR